MVNKFTKYLLIRLGLMETALIVLAIFFEEIILFILGIGFGYALAILFTLLHYKDYNIKEK